MKRLQEVPAEQNLPGRVVNAIQRKIMQDKQWMLKTLYDKRWMRWNYINQAVNAVKKPFIAAIA